MSNAIYRIAELIVLAWVRVYLAGLPGQVREQRRAEIASDLYEHRLHAQEQGRSPAAAALHLLARCVAGALDDLTWRTEEGYALGGTGMLQMMRSPSTYLNYVLFMACAAMLLPIGIGLGVVGFVGAVVGVTVPAAFVATPFIYWMADVNIGAWVIDTLPEALVVAAAGLVIFAAEFALVNFLVRSFRGVFTIRIGRFKVGS